MTGFGPFAEAVELDFQSVTDHPLFGIYGPTGSGKTTVLDAISFALFGESSGAERQAEGLRSHFVGSEVETVVELLFETGGVRYFVRRSPKQEIARQRGEGTRERPGEAYLFDATDLEPREVSFPDRCGRAMAEKKVGEVNKLLEEVVGFRAEQFRQVVLLPQGRFRELLTASSHQRSDILKRLFETGIYEALASRLKNRAADLGREKGILQERLRTILSSAGVESEEELAEGQKEIARELTFLQERRKKSEEQLEASRRRLEEEQEKQQKFRERDEAREALSGLEAQAEEISALREVLERADAAAEGELTFQRLAEARRAVKEYSQILDERRGALAAATERKESGDRRLEELLRGEEEREALKARVAEYDRLKEEVKRLREERQRHGQARDQREKLEAEYRQAEEAFSRAAGEAERLSSAIEELQGLQERLHQVGTEIDALSRRAALLSQKREANKKVDTLSDHLQELRKEERKTSEELRDARETLRAKEQLRWDRYRFTLAESLDDGLPCPVCGSTDHPAPARQLADSVESSGEDEPARLREVVERHLARQGELQREIASAEAELKALRERIGELDAELAGAPESDGQMNSEDRLTSLRREKEELQERLGKEQRYREERETERAKREKWRQRQQELGSRLQEARDKEGRAEARVQEIEARVPEELREAGVLEARRGEQARRLEGELRQLRAAESEAKEAAGIWAGEKTRVEESERLLREAQKKAEERLREFGSRLAELGFSSEEAFEAARRTPEERKGWRQRLETYAAARAAAQDRLRRAQEATEKEPEPRVDEATEEVRSLEEEKTALLETVATRRGRLEQLEKSAADYRATLQRYREVDERHRLTSQLSDIAEGRNEIRTRLVDYVLSVYFEEVLTQANQRLFTMSNRRYTLHRRGASSSGRGHAGLDIDVHDAYTDRMRDASTLSGGEGFLASLALALGLSDTVQAELGGLHLEVIFIDEGFGHLDEEALEEALNTLDSLTGSGRSVGIISHVEEVKRRVPAGFEVSRSLKGSSVENRRGGIR
jgi:exonuclease SbcC